MPQTPRHERRSRSAPPLRTPCPHECHDEDVALQKLADRYKVRWECWLEEWELWSEYSPAARTVIEAAWQRGATSVLAGPEDHDEKWTICFISMTQTNCRYGTSRTVRRILVTHA